MLLMEDIFQEPATRSRDSSLSHYLDGFQTY